MRKMLLGLLGRIFGEVAKDLLRLREQGPVEFQPRKEGTSDIDKFLEELEEELARHD